MRPPAFHTLPCCSEALGYRTPGSPSLRFCAAHEHLSLNELLFCERQEVGINHRVGHASSSGAIASNVFQVGDPPRRYLQRSPL